MFPKTPPMGFNTWNTFADKIDEKLIRETADAMVETGLRDAGYEYLVIDDCWSERQRDPVTHKIIPDHVKFPNGMKAVSDYVHSRGLKFGMYSCIGTRTCADYPGSFDHEYLDAETFAEYGADFLKYDTCYKPAAAASHLLYRRMSMALQATGRDILLSACNWGMDGVHDWIRSTGAGMFRSTGDINDSYESFKQIFLSQLGNFSHNGVGCFNDIDMLTVGMYARGNAGLTGCTDTEYRTEFALWCMFASPLMIGCDVRDMNDFTRELLTNPRLIRINQDIACRPPFIAVHTEKDENNVYVRLLSDNEIAIMFTNLSDEENIGTWLAFEDIGLPASSGKALALTDAFTGEDAGVFKEYKSERVKPHDCALYIAKIVDAE